MSELHVAVLGATGATGREVVHAAMRRGHAVTAVVREAGRGSFPAGVREMVWPEVTGDETLAAVFRGVDAVISTLGGAAQGPTTVCEDGGRATVAAMSAAGVTRLVTVSAHGVCESHDRSLYALAVWVNVPERMRDKERMEHVITRSDLEWTIVRPPALKNAPARGHYRTGVDLPIRLWSSISRSDLADFLVREVEAPAYVHAFPRIVQ